jgi:superfamily II DNA or RNA helicase
MVSQKIHQLKHYYENGDDNIGQDFVMPCLRECLKYRRGAGFFKSSSLIAYAEALYHVVKDNVQIEVLCSPALDRDHHLLDKQSENQTQEQKLNTINRLQEEIILKIFKYQQNPETHTKEKIDILAYLIASEQLKIKVAIRKNDGWPENMPTEEEIDKHSDLYHVKRGYFTFSNNEIIAFNGSFNETDNGHRRSYEDAYVHKDWEEHSKKMAETIIKKTDRDWEAGNPNLYVRTLSDDVIKRIRESAPPQGKLPNKKDKTKNAPIKIPININDELNIELRPYQEEAIKNWEDNDHQGIFAMATGTGKTLTAIAALKKLRDKNPGSVTVLTVPYIPLAEQWIGELNKYDLKTIPAFTGHQDWETKLKNLVTQLLVWNQDSDYKLPVIVAVNKTFSSISFQEMMDELCEANEKIDRLLIVDECHHFNKADQIKNLPESFNQRIGLSATPFDQFEKDDDKRYLEKYFTKKEIINYTLEMAIPEYLVPYNYYPIPVSLNEKETEELEEITSRIGKFYEAAKNDPSYQNQLNIAHGEKKRLLSRVEDKLTKLKELITKQGKQNNVLAYCGASSLDETDESRKKIIQKVSQIFAEQHWKVGRITAAEKDPKHRLDNINDLKKGDLDVIVSIKILDEGIDIPSCKIAYILASSRSNREWIQRRGRVLRKYDEGNKKHADIYDFVIIRGANNGDAIKKLIDDESERIYEFSKSALNKEDSYNLIKDK